MAKNRLSGWQCQIRAGHGALKIPRRWTLPYLPSFPGSGRSAEKALTAVIHEAYVHSISTRSMDDLVQALGGIGFSQSYVGRLCEEIDARVDAFHERPMGATGPIFGSTRPA